MSNHIFFAVDVNKLVANLLNTTDLWVIGSKNADFYHCLMHCRYKHTFLGRCIISHFFSKLS